MCPQWYPCVSLSLGDASLGASGMESKWSKCKVGASTIPGEDDRTIFFHFSLQYFMRPDLLLLTRSSFPSDLKNCFVTNFVIFWFPFFLISYFPVFSHLWTTLGHLHLEKWHFIYLSAASLILSKAKFCHWDYRRNTAPRKTKAHFS